MRALVTGGAGFIGCNLVRELVRRGHDVTVLDNLSTGDRARLEGLPRVTWVPGDVCDEGAVARAVRGARVVFHLAASVGNVRSLESAAADSQVNVIGTLCVLEAARREGVRRLVYSSSAAIFGEPRYVPQDETHPVEPDSPYGVSKLAGEKHCLCYAKLYGLGVVSLRYFNVYGPHQAADAYGNVIPIFAHRLLRGEPLHIFGDGEQTRDFVNVADVVQANLAAAEAEGVTGAFNVGSGAAITVRRLARIMQETAGVGVPVMHEPPRKGEVRHSRAAIGLAERRLGYRPTVQIEEGLRDYLAWMRSSLAAVEA